MKSHCFHIHCVYNVSVYVEIVTMTMWGAASNYSSEAEDSGTMTDKVTREALFLVGSKSRFGRAVRFNNRFVQ